MAAEEGRVAAIAAVRALGKAHADGQNAREKSARAALARARKFAQVTRGMMRLKPALFDLITDETMVCRCEGAVARDVAAAIADGDATLRGVKGRTRAGMGRCQGRICGYLVSRMIEKHTGAGMDQIQLDTPRLPVKPVLLGALAADVDR